jgi:hypothetical protein
MEREDIVEYLAFLTTMDLDLAKAQRPFAKADETDRPMDSQPASQNESLDWNPHRKDSAHCSVAGPAT